jgi:tetratricopeptide (TPR) repeat protein
MTVLFASSFFALRKVEAISFYSAGRNYIARGELARGDEELRRAIRRGADAIPLKEAYVALIQVTMMQAGKVGDLVSEARAALPESTELRIFQLVVESLESPDNRPQTNATLDQFRGHEDRRVPNLIAQTYHNLALGYLRSGELTRAVSALDRSLLFQPDRDSTRKLLARVASRAEEK